MNHFCTIINHKALPATEPVNINIALQAKLRMEYSDSGPIKKFETIIARYTPIAKPLTGKIPATLDQWLLSTCSQGLPPLQPAIVPPIRLCQLITALKTRAVEAKPNNNQRHQGQDR
jgi:hypothetical protein